ncbi:MAG: trigger factor [Deltaproteobacteria bacterium]
MTHHINNIDENCIDLTINISQSDYLPDFESELKKKKKDANFKGFRKGMVPDNFLKKAFGNGILSEVINKKMDSSLNDILKENNIDLMLSPILSEKQQPLDINVYDMKDYSVTFSLHKKPTAVLKGISEEDTYKFYEIEPDNEIIENDVKNLKTRNGKFVPYDGSINDDVILTISAIELESGNIKDKPYDTEFSIKTSEITEKYKQKIIDLKVGDTFDFDIYSFMTGADEKKVRDYLLNISEKDFKVGEDTGIGKDFRGTIEKTESFEPAELNDELFASLNIPEVNNEDDYRTFIKNDLQKFHNSESEKLLHLEISERLKEINQFNFSGDYIKKWVKQHYPDKTEEETENITEKSIRDLQWQNIVDILIKKYNINVSEEELDLKIRQNAASIVGYNPEYFDRVVEMIRNDEKYVNNIYNEMFIEKIFGEISKNITKVTEKISFEDFKKLAEKYRKDSHEHDHEHEHQHEQDNDE